MMYSETTELSFLVATPQLQDELFAHAVILVLSHDTDGAVGLMVNRPTQMPVSELLDDVPVQRKNAWLAGPVEQRLGWCVYYQALHLADEYCVGAGVYVSTSLETIQTLLAQHLDFEIFLGYSGWDAGQLERECAEGSWLWLNTDASFLSTPAQDRWLKAYQLLGVQPNRMASGSAHA